jgi:hypothetical protein
MKQKPPEAGYIFSKTYRIDLPGPLAPVMQLNDPKQTSTSTRFLKPEIFKRVNIKSSRDVKFSGNALKAEQKLLLQFL